MKRFLRLAALTAIIVVLGGALFFFIQFRYRLKTKPAMEGGIFYDQSNVIQLSYLRKARRKIPLQLEEVFPADSWYAVEYSSALRSNFRWAKGENPELRLPLIAKSECTLYLRLFSYPHPFQREQKIKFFLNNHLIKTLTITPAEAEYSLILPERFLKMGDNRLIIQYSYAVNLKYEAQSSDSRILSLAISGLAIKAALLYYWSDSPGHAQQVIGNFVPFNFSFDVKPPKKSSLEFCYRYRPFTPDFFFPFPVRFSVTAYKGRSKGEIFCSSETPLEKGDLGWKHIRLNLSNYEGKTIRLKFSAEIPESASFRDEIIHPFPLYVEIGSPIFSTTETKKDDSRLNIILISVDALRADHLSCYGYNRKTSPFLDSLAKNGILFQQAYACAAWTLPSHASMLTGLLPSQHGLYKRRKLAQNLPLLPEIFKQNGYTTFGLACGGFLSKEYGWDRGFDIFSSYTMDQSLRSKYAFSQAQSWIGLNRNSPFFLFLHTYETHQQLIPPEPYRSMFYPEYRGPIVVQREYIRPEMTRQLSDADKKKILSLYDGEIRYTDDLIFSLFDALKKYNIDERTLIIVTADHGEEYWDNSESAMVHGMLKYHIIRVPFIMWNPNLFPAPRVISKPVSLVDLAPTVIEAAKLKSEYATSTFDGISLLPYLKSRKELPDRIVFCQKAKINKLSAIFREFKYDFSLPDQKGKLYNIKIDPLETHDLSTELPEITKIMRQGILKKLGSITDKIMLKISGKDQSAPFRIKITTDTYLMDLKSFDVEREDSIIVSPNRKEAEIVSTAFSESDIFLIQTLRMNESLSFAIELNGKLISPSDIALFSAGNRPSSNPFSLALADFMFRGKGPAIRSIEEIKTDSTDKYIFIAMIEEKDRYQAAPLEMDEKLRQELKSLGYLGKN